MWKVEHNGTSFEIKYLKLLHTSISGMQSLMGLYTMCNIEYGTKKCVDLFNKLRFNSENYIYVSVVEDWYYAQN